MTVRSVTYPAADGESVPAYLTLPPSGPSGRDLPAIILPHGGPEARDEWGFDWLANISPTRATPLSRPNYRFGRLRRRHWLQQNGFRNWRTSIGDITAGALVGSAGDR